MKEAIRELIELSHYAAEHPRFVQGGGGNCSVKFSGKLAIKASGYFLEDVSGKTGYAVIDLETNQPVAQNGPKVSMETPLHRFLNTYVIHTHPIAVGALVCAKQGQQIFRKLFPDACYQWIDYAPPGNSIFEKARKLTIRMKNGKFQDQVWFLANHGFFVSSDDKKKCMKLHESTVRKLESFFGEAPPLAGLPPVPIHCFLTPDMVVYHQTEADHFSEKQRIAAHETQVFARQVFALITRKKWDPAWLEPLDVAYLLEMQEEQFRRKLLEKPE